MEGLRGAPFGYVSVDDEGLIADVNDACARALGCSRGDLVGQPFATICSPRTRALFAARLAPALAEGRRVDEAHVSLRAPRGADVPVVMSAARAVHDGRERNDLFFLAARRGRAFQRRLAATRRAARARIERMEAELAQRDRLAALGTLAAGVAHELNSPLAYVSTSLDLVSESLAGASPRGSDVDRLATFLDEARDGVERIRRIVADLRALSRADEERRVPVSLGRVVEAALRIAGNTVRHRARLDVRVASPSPIVLADEWRLAQVVINLLVNAEQALPDERAVEENVVSVRVGEEDGRAVIEVRDNGPGVPAAIAGRVFEPFFTTKPIGAGTGLGLSVCQRIVAAFGGSITIESDGGARFRVSLPLAGDAAAPLDPEAPRAPRSRRTPARSPAVVRVLVVDDDERLANMIPRALDDYDVIVTTSGRDAIARIDAGDAFDVVLCDLMMPDMTGVEVHAEVARRDRALADRIVFLTGGVFSEPASAFLASVPNAVLNKPFLLPQLREACAIAAAKRPREP